MDETTKNRVRSVLKSVFGTLRLLPIADLEAYIAERDELFQKMDDTGWFMDPAYYNSPQYANFQTEHELVKKLLDIRRGADQLRSDWYNVPPLK